MKKNHLVIVIVLIIAVSAAAFFGGMKYQQSKSPRFSRQFGQGQGNNNQPRNNFRPVNGEIIAADEKSITVKLADGSSKIILLAEKTVINKAAEGSKEDLKTGEKIIVIGMQNSDGSITAENIQLNPQFRGKPQ